MKSYKKENPTSYSFGVFPTLELLKNRISNVNQILYSERGAKNEGLTEILNICGEHEIETVPADSSIRKLTGNENTYAVGIFTKYEEKLLAGNHLILDRIDDCGNLGTIIRTMIAYDIKDLALIGPCADIFNPKTIRASMGAVFRIRYVYFQEISEYRKHHSNSLYTFMTDGVENLTEAQFIPPYSLVFGNEGAGLDDHYKHISRTVRIPQSHDVDSLNLSVSAGIGLYASSIKQL